MKNMSRNNEWSLKVLALIKGGNSAAAINQIKVAPSVKDLQHLRTALAAARLPGTQTVAEVIADQIDLLAAPRLHRSP